jgi:hypothetical protein
MLIKFYKFVDSLKNSPARKDRLLLATTIGALVLNVGLWLFLYFELKAILAVEPDKLMMPIHYNVFFGIDLYQSWYMAYMFPGIGLGIWLINLILSWILYSKKNLASQFLGVTSFLAQLSLGVTGLLAISLNL